MLHLSSLFYKLDIAVIPFISNIQYYCITQANHFPKGFVTPQLHTDSTHVQFSLLGVGLLTINKTSTKI